MECTVDGVLIFFLPLFQLHNFSVQVGNSYPKSKIKSSRANKRAATCAHLPNPAAEQVHDASLIVPVVPECSDIVTVPEYDFCE